MTSGSRVSGRTAAGSRPLGRSCARRSPGLRIRLRSLGVDRAQPCTAARRQRPVEGVQDRRGQRGRKRDRGCVERVIVDHVVSGLPHRAVDPCKGLVGNAQRRSDGTGRRAIERGCQSPVIDSRVDHLNSRDLRPGGRVEMNLVASVHQSARQIGDERLRPTLLRLPDRGDERGDDREPHRVTTLNARSHGGLIPKVS